MRFYFLSRTLDFVFRIEKKTISFEFNLDSFSGKAAPSESHYFFSMYAIQCVPFDGCKFNISKFGENGPSLD